MSVQELGELLKRVWSAAELTIRPGVSAQRLAQFEQQFDTQLSPDMRAYLSAVDGMEPDEMDPHHIRFWPLEEIKPVQEEGGCLLGSTVLCVCGLSAVVAWLRDCPRPASTRDYCHGRRGDASDGGAVVYRLCVLVCIRHQANFPSRPVRLAESSSSQLSCNEMGSGVGCCSLLLSTVAAYPSG